MNKNYKEKILKLIDSNKKKKIDLIFLKKHLNIKNKKQERDLEKTLEICSKEGSVVLWDNKFYNTPKNLKMIVCEIVNSSNKFVFGEERETKQQFFIPNKLSKGAITGDLVLIKIKKNKKEDKNTEGKVVRILNKVEKLLVANYIIENNKPYIEFVDKNIIGKFKVRHFEGVVNGHKVLVKPIKEEFEIVEIIGHKNEPHTELLSLLYKYGIPTDFKKETLEQVNNIDEKVVSDEIGRRKDYRNELVITIDSEDAKDLDDAIHLKKNEKGNFVLGVHIADVSHYVTEGSALDEEASERGTSIYLINKVIPMLPQKLSNGICSLNPNVNRLTLTCEMEFTKKGSLINYNFYESVINTVERMTYKKVYELINDLNNEDNKKYDYLLSMIKDMHELSQILNKRRIEEGSIDFDLPEPNIHLDENNRPTNITVRERTESEKLIEEFMLIANQTVATHFNSSEMLLPFVYRIHELPKEDKIEFLSMFVRRFNDNLSLDVENIKPKKIQEMLEKIKGEEGEEAIKTLTLRTMNKAKYSTENKGHFGLAFKNYTHFTSPIRRYPDLLVHRLLRTYIFEKNTSKKKTEFFKRKLPKLCEKSSKMERLAIEIERELQEIKKAEYMNEKLGTVYEGRISSITNFGFFVQLDNTIEGLVPAEKMKDDYYLFDEENHIMKGKNNGKVYSIGQKVKVEVVFCDVEKQYIDFKLIN